MHRFTYYVIPPKRKRQVTNAPTHLDPWTFLLNHPSRLDEVHGVFIVLFEPGGNGENIRVENYVYRVDIGVFGQ